MTEINENISEKDLLKKIIGEELIVFVTENKDVIVKRAEKKLRALLKTYEEKAKEG